MKNGRAWEIIVSTFVLSLAGACGGPSSTDVEETSELRQGRGFSVSACCRRAYSAGPRRGHCIAEAMRGRGSCAHAGGHDAGACDAGRGGRGGVGGFGGSDGGTGGEAGDAGNPDAADGGPAPACVPASPTDVWEPVVLPGRPSVLFETRLNDLWMLQQGPSGAVFRWNGTTWTTVLTVPVSDFFYTLWGSSPEDIWLGGTRLLHWDGATWSDLTPPELAVAPYPAVRSLWGRAPDDVWLTAAAEPTRIFHWDGSLWTERTPPVSSTGSRFQADGIWASSSDRAWAAGHWVTSDGFRANEAVLQWRGGPWESALTDVTSPDSSSSIWGSADDDIWVASRSGMAHFDGVSWSHVPGTLGTGKLWGSCASDVWGLGGGNEYGDLGLRHFDGINWSTTLVAHSGNGVGFTTITGTGPDDVWVAGNTGALAETRYVAVHRHPGDPAPACGNVRLDPGEECEPPNGYTCDATCLVIPICGNGIVERGEECDYPHSAPPYPACDYRCHMVPNPACVELGRACDATLPCCDNQTCSNGYCGGSSCVASGAACATGGLACCGGLRCTAGTCQCVPTGTSCTGADKCCLGYCANGQCSGCLPLGGLCDAANPCCSGLVCSSSGICVKPQPTCMPDGALCSATSPCCSGASCVNGLCGGACVLDGAACDGLHPCCRAGSTCTNGVCGGVACVPLGQNCGGPGGCCSGSLCGGFGLCRSQGGSCADVGGPCNVVTNGCCSGSTCVGGTCVVVLGCYPPGQDCNDGQLGTPQCCSGICRLNVGAPRGQCL